MVSAESISTLVDGEMPYEGTGEWNANYVNPIQAIKQFKDHRYTTFSVTHSYPQAILNWKIPPLQKDSWMLITFLTIRPILMVE